MYGENDTKGSNCNMDLQFKQRNNFNALVKSTRRLHKYIQAFRKTTPRQNNRHGLTNFGNNVYFVLSFP